MKTALPIIERGGRFILQKSFKGYGQKQVPLGKDKKIAEARCKRFLACAEISGFQVALDELNGQPTIKKSDDLNFEQIEKLYLAYVKQSDNPPRAISITSYLNGLKLIMGDKTLSKINMDEVKGRMIKDPNNKSNLTSFSSYVRNAKAVFKPSAMKYYAKMNKTVFNPFKDTEYKTPSVEPYSPFSKDVLAKIMSKPKEMLPPQEQLIIKVCLHLALRRSEATAMRVSWWSVQESKVLLSVQQEVDYIPKSAEKRIIPVSITLYNELVELRNQCIVNDPYLKDNQFFIPCEVRKGTPATRLHRRFANVNEFLRSLGINDQKPAHGLRKYGGSVICARTSLLEASRILGHSSPVVTAKHYTSILDYTPIEGIEIAEIKVEKTPEQVLADKLGITVEDLLKKLG